MAVFGLISGAIAAVGIYFYIAPSLPPAHALREVQFQVPLRIFSRDGLLIAEYGEKKRSPLKYRDIPPTLVKAILAAEDDRFFVHPGVDYQGILRAIYNLAVTGERSQGGSTITMQVARNFFLSREKTYLRKITEILLALKIERELSKEDILELYLNKIYLGNRSYGFEAAAKVYYGKPLKELDLAQLAMLAGLPKAPSTFNPIANPERALIRRNYVLRRMHKLAYIDDEQYEIARSQPVTASLHRLSAELEAPYVAEMVRNEMVSRFGEDAYIAGYKVTTTIDSHRQRAANNALRRTLLEYDQRHGYRGPVTHHEFIDMDDPQGWLQLLKGQREYPSLVPALVVEIQDRSANVFLKTGELVTLPWEGLSWARRYISANRRGPKPTTAEEVLTVGDVVLVQQSGSGTWRLAQKPQVEGALISLNPQNGAIWALVGGYDFFSSKFNRVTQAKRQPGSSFKPFIYSAALEKGFTPASIINDAPVVFDDPGLEATWRPENYSGKFFGPTRLREALTRSRNLVSIRLLREIGIRDTIEYVGRFGFDTEQLPHDLSLALGSGAVAPIELARAHSVFANGGYLIEPYFIEEIANERGEVIFRAEPLQVCESCDPEPPPEASPPSDEEELIPVGINEPPFPDEAFPALQTAPEPRIRPAPRVISPQNAYQINSIMRDVIQRGNGRKAWRRFGRKDLAGKTGTTNDQRDAWFVGFTRNVLAISWIGFDNPEPLGNRETGAGAALPMWIYYMEEVLPDIPERYLDRPPGLVTVRIDANTGYLTSASNPNAIFETFRQEYVPQRQTTTFTKGTPSAPDTELPQKEESDPFLF